MGNIFYNFVLKGRKNGTEFIVQGLLTCTTDQNIPKQLSIPFNKLCTLFGKVHFFGFEGVHFWFCCSAMPKTGLINLQRHLLSKSINLIQENLGYVQKLEPDQRPQL